MWVSKLDPNKLAPIEGCECGCNEEGVGDDNNNK